MVSKSGHAKRKCRTWIYMCFKTAVRRIIPALQGFDLTRHISLSDKEIITWGTWRLNSTSWFTVSTHRISARTYSPPTHRLWYASLHSWRHNECDGVSNHRRLNRFFRCRSKKTLKPRVTGLCEGNSPVTGEFPSQRASNAENVSIW